MLGTTITKQGQITLPVAARARVGFEPGDRLMVLPVGEKLELVKDKGIGFLKGIFAKYAVGKPKLTRKRLEELRVQMYTERYKRYLKQNEKSNN